MVVADCKATHEVSDIPEEKKNSQCTEKPAHGIDHERHRSIVRSEISEEPGGKHKDRVARRVTDLKLVSLNYKLTAIPIRGGRLQSEPISDESDDKDHPSGHIINKIILTGNHQL